MSSLIAMYVGPDQVMPLTSALAFIVGFIMVFWTKVLGVFRKIMSLFRRSEAPTSVASAAPAQQNDPRK